jgi:hypothetical protein
MMIYFIYATLLGWLIMILFNYHSHKKYINSHKNKFFDILDRYHEEPESVETPEKLAFSFTPELIEKREFIKYLSLGRFKYILLDTTLILLSFILIGYTICLLDAYTKTIKYEKIICQWSNNCEELSDPKEK